MYVLCVTAALLLVVAHLVASAIHLKWRTNTLMKMTQTTGPILSGFVSFFLPPDSIIALSISEVITKTANMHSHFIVYVHIYCTLNICLHSTWTKFQTPASSPQLNFALFKHSQCCLSHVANLQWTPLKTQMYECTCCASVFDFCRSDLWKLKR